MSCIESNREDLLVSWIESNHLIKKYILSRELNQFNFFKLYLIDSEKKSRSHVWAKHSLSPQLIITVMRRLYKTF